MTGSIVFATPRLRWCPVILSGVYRRPLGVALSSSAFLACIDLDSPVRTHLTTKPKSTRHTMRGAVDTMRVGVLLLAGCTQALGKKRPMEKQAPLRLTLVPISDPPTLPTPPTPPTALTLWPTKTPTSSKSGSNTPHCVVNPIVTTVTRYITRRVVETATTTIWRCDRGTMVEAPVKAQQLEPTGTRRSLTPTRSLTTLPSIPSTASHGCVKSQQGVARTMSPGKRSDESWPSGEARKAGTSRRMGLREILDMFLLAQVAGLFVIWLLWARVF